MFTAIAIGVLTVILTFNALNVLDDRARSGHPLQFWEPLVWEGSSGLYFVAASPLMRALACRFWLLAPPRALKLGVHLAAALLISLGHVTIAGAMRWGAYKLIG